MIGDDGALKKVGRWHRVIILFMTSFTHSMMPAICMEKLIHICVIELWH